MGRYGSGPGLDECQLHGSPTRPAGFGQRVRRIGWPNPTHQRHTLPWTRRPEAAGRMGTAALEGVPAAVGTHRFSGARPGPLCEKSAFEFLIRDHLYFAQ